jgi:HYDIN/CFA65/VesB family protein
LTRHGERGFSSRQVGTGRPRARRRAAVALVLLALASSVRADGPAGARLAVEPAAFDFGNVRPEKTLQKDLLLRNFGDAELVIQKVSTTCGCTVAGSYLKRVAPGASTTLRIAFTTPATAGRTEQTVTIETNDPERPRIHVKVAATVVASRKPAPRPVGTLPD